MTFIKACAHVGTEQYKADLLATALAHSYRLLGQQSNVLTVEKVM